MSFTEPELAGVEARTQELGVALLNHAARYQPSWGERLQDRLVGLAAAGPSFRSSLLRFVDVLAALDHDRGGRAVKELGLEYFRRPFPHLPLPVRVALAIGNSTAVPAPLYAAAARWTGRLIARRFIAEPGAGFGAALDHLSRHGRYGSFDILGEHVWSDAEAERYTRANLALILDLGRRPDVADRTPFGKPRYEVSVKLSSLEANFNPVDPAGTFAQIGPRLRRLCHAARGVAVGLNVDMEQFEFRDLTWELLERLASRDDAVVGWGDLGIVVQGYLTDSLDSVDRARRLSERLKAPLHVRLVRGAYWDYESAIAAQRHWEPPVFHVKAATDRCFETLVVELLRAAPEVRLAIGSHNLRSHAWAEAVRERLGLPDQSVEHQTLFRTAEATSRALAAMGWVDRDYVPIGQLVPGMAYLVRRVLENSSQVGFLMQNPLREAPVRLLAPPPPVEAAPGRPADTGFQNHPPARLFDPPVRKEFADALRRTRDRWGGHVALRIGGEMVEGMPTSDLSPSHPDPDAPVAAVDFAEVVHVGKAIKAAEAGQQEWGRRSPAERAGVLVSAADLMAADRDELAAWIVHEAGKDWAGALADVDEAIDFLRFYAQQALDHREEIVADYEPLGIVAAIPPWNFPLAIPCGMVAAGLVAGNAVILKPAEHTPLIGTKLIELLHRAGVPAKAAICLPGHGETVGAALAASDSVDMVAFTGSRAVGESLHRRAAGSLTRRGRFKRVVAEMGGKNAIIAYEDADLDETIQAIVESTYGHSNQKCSACSRVLVHRPILQRLRERLIEASRNVTWGQSEAPGTVLVPLISSEAAARVRELADIGRHEGRVLLDLQKDGTSGLVLRPLVIEMEAEEALGSRIAREEVFGPVLTLIPFDDEADAIELANATDYGLTAGIFSRSPGRIGRLVDAVEAGNIYVNRPITGARVGVEPFGGYKASGTGPKAGGEGYLWAFLARQSAPTAGLGPPAADESGLEGDLEAWTEGSPRRAAIVRAALERTAKDRGWAAAANYAERLIEESVALERPIDTISMPGQRTFLTRSTPLGVGIVAVGSGLDRDEMIAAIIAPLLAGNGVAVVGAAVGSEAAELVASLHGAGVSQASLKAVSADSIESAPTPNGGWGFALACCDMTSAAELFRLVSRNDEGLPLLPKLLSLHDLPPVGDPRLLHRFVHEKTVAIRTLRHGADLSY